MSQAKAHKTRAYHEYEQQSQEHKQSKTNAQRRHQTVFVETNHKDHKILSFDAAESKRRVDILLIPTQLVLLCS
jgi:hypothetical protein